MLTYDSSGTISPSVIPKKVQIETDTGAFAKADAALKKEREEKRLQRHRLILGTSFTSFTSTKVQIPLIRKSARRSVSSATASS
jgi:hypothetical protein